MAKVPVPKVIHRLAMSARSEGGASHVHVTGHLEVRHQVAAQGDKGTEEVQLLVPINYKLRHDEDPARHEEILDELQAKTRHWGAKHLEHKAWQGTKEKVGEADIHITDCGIQFHALNDWKLSCSWNETHPGAPTTRHHKVISYHTPFQAMSCEALQALVRAEVASRAAASASVSAHKETFRALNLTHSAEVARLRGAGNVREAGPALRPGEPVGVDGGLPGSKAGKQ